MLTKGYHLAVCHCHTWLIPTYFNAHITHESQAIITWTEHLSSLKTQLHYPCMPTLPFPLIKTPSTPALWHVHAKWPFPSIKTTNTPALRPVHAKWPHTVRVLLCECPCINTNLSRWKSSVTKSRKAESGKAESRQQSFLCFCNSYMHGRSKARQEESRASTTDGRETTHQASCTQTLHKPLAFLTANTMQIAQLNAMRMCSLKGVGSFVHLHVCTCACASACRYMLL